MTGKDPYEGFNNDQRVRIWQTQLDQNRMLFEAVGPLATSTIRGLMLINGGAAVAVLAFLGHLVSADAIDGVLTRSLVTPMIMFAIGAASAVLTAGFAYLSQIIFSEGSNLRSSRMTGGFVRFVAICFALAGMVLFVVGIVKVGTAISQVAA